MRVYLLLFFIFLLLTVAFVFGSQNTQQISLNYLIARVDLSVASAVSLFTFIGFVLGLMVALLWKLTGMLRSKQKSLPAKVES